MNHKQRTLIAKTTVEFIRAHPEGVTSDDLKTNNIPRWPLGRLVTLKLIKGSQVKEPERGPRAYHWLWKAV